MTDFAVGYDIHGVTIFGWVHSGAIVDALDRRLLAFRTRPPDGADVHLVYGLEPLGRPAGAGRVVYESPGVGVHYFDDSGELYVDHPAGVVLRCHPGSGHIRVAVDPDNPAATLIATHPLLTIALIEVLKARGRYMLHAACAAVGGRGIVVVGPSGAGKSTLAIALARAGMDFLADDMVFLARRDGVVEVLGFPDEVDVTDQTIAMYPELVTAANGLSKNGRQKRSLRLEEALPVTAALGCTPAALLFARVAHCDHSRVTPLDATEALVELAPNVLLTSVDAAQAHLDVLAALARQVPCWRLDTGRDLAEVSGLLGAMAA